MNLLVIIFVLLAVGIILHLINRYAPIDPPFKSIIFWVVIGITLIWLLRVLGVFEMVGRVHI